MLGAGPVWNNYQEKVMLPCKNYWWTNVLYINNIVPANGSFDEKCMPWAWFIPCMVQLSLILPPLLWCYTQAKQKGFGYVRAMFAAITVTIWTTIFIVTYKLNLPGALPITILPVNPGQNDPNKLFYIDF
jgi:hypothetical protein